MDTNVAGNRPKMSKNGRKRVKMDRFGPKWVKTGGFWRFGAVLGRCWDSGNSHTDEHPVPRVRDGTGGPDTDFWDAAVAVETRGKEIAGMRECGNGRLFWDTFFYAMARARGDNRRLPNCAGKGRGRGGDVGGGGGSPVQRFSSGAGSPSGSAGAGGVWVA